MDLISDESQDRHDDYYYEHVVAAHTPDFLGLPIVNLSIFYYNHVLPPLLSSDNLYHRICHALSTIPFCDKFVFAQFWAAICFGACTVLTTRGQPFGLSVYTDGFWSYHTACSDHNSYVYHKEHEQIVCIGAPARVFRNGSPEWTRDVSLYNDKIYPQRDDALRCGIQGSLAMPVFEATGQCIGVVEIVMANGKDNYCYEMAQVCRAYEKVGLQSSERNGNVKIGTYEHQPHVRQRETRSSSITRNDLTKLFGLPKAEAAKLCGSKVGAFRDLHQRYGIKEWPCKARGIVKAPAHRALINGSASSTISQKDRLVIKDLEYKLMQDDGDINCEGDAVECMGHLISNDISEQLNEISVPVLLELYVQQ